MRIVCSLLIDLLESTSEKETENAGNQNGHVFHLSAKGKKCSISWSDQLEFHFLVLHYLCAFLELKFYFTFFFISCLLSCRFRDGETLASFRSTSSGNGEMVVSKNGHEFHPSSWSHIVGICLKMTCFSGFLHIPCDILAWKHSGWVDCKIFPQITKYLKADTRLTLLSVDCR